jgi:N-acetylmuramoyl-L-alanine amidase
VFVFSLMTVGQASAAADDITGHWAEDHVRALVKNEIMTGTGPNQYSPDRNVTRAEFATLVSKALKLPSSEKSFHDLGQAGSGLQDGVKRAAGAGIVSGGTDGNFYPNKPMSREEMAVMVDNAMKYKDKQSTYSKLPFVDVDQILYKDAVGRIAGASIIVGDKNNAFNPKQNASRGMAAVVLSRMIEKIDGVSILPEKPKPEPKPEQKPEEKPGDKPEVKPEQQQKLPFIVIDAGHGGVTGAKGNGIVEKELALDVSLKLKDLLAKSSIPFALTRETDVAVSLSQRVNFAKEKNADLFVSIHANSYSNPSANGIETLYPVNSIPKDNYVVSEGKPERQDSQALATYVQKRLVEKLELADRKIKKRDNLYVLNKTSMPAILAEIGFMTNATDAAKLNTQEYRQKAAEAIYLGIVDYLKAKGYKL